MTSTVPVGFADKFKADFMLKAQQKVSRLEGTVRTDPDWLEARFGYFDYIGKVKMQKRTSRHQDTGVVEVPHSRRRITLADYELPHLLDKQDVMRMVADPQGKYLMNAIAAANRQKDEIIINASDAVSYAIDEDMAATPVAIPNTHLLTESGTDGLTLAKLLNIKEILAKEEADEDGNFTAVVTARQITNMFNTTEIKSADYNSVKVLAEGKVDTFLGFRFIRTELLKIASSKRRCLFYGKNAIGLAVGEDITVDIGPRRDKGNATQLLVTMSADATRIEDEAIVVQECHEA